MSKKEFSDSERFLAQNIENALKTIFSYEGLLLIKSGLMSINKIGNEFKLEFIMYNLEVMTDIFNVFNMRPFTADYGFTNPNYDYNPKYFVDSKNSVRTWLSLCLSGHMTVFPKNVLRTFAGNEFLNELFSNHVSNEFTPYYHSQVWKMFYNRFFTSYDSREAIGQRIADAKMLMWKLIAPQIDATIKINTIDSYKVPVPKFASDQAIWTDLMRIYYKISIADSLYFPMRNLDPTQAFFDYIVHGKVGSILKLGKAGTNILVKDVGIQLDPIFNLLTEEQIRMIYPALFFTWNHRVHTQQSTQKRNIELFKQLTTDMSWSQVENPITHSYNQLTSILTDPNIQAKNKITIQFRRPSRSGIGFDKKLKDRVYNYQVDFNTLQEIQKHNIIITQDDFDPKNQRILKQKIYSIIYYMVKYQAFIVMKDGDTSSKSIILAGTLSHLYRPDYIKALTVDGSLWGNLVMCPEAQAKYNNWQASWNKDNKGRKIWNDLNEFIPFYILFDYKSNRFRELFSTKFGVRIEDLV